MSAGSNATALLRRLAGFAVAAALLAFAASQVPWRDTLTLRPGQEAPGESYPGQILGEWRTESQTVLFRFAEGVAAGELLTGHPLEAVLARGGVVEATREGISAPAAEGPRRTLACRVEWRPGMPRAFRELELAGLLPAAACLLLASVFVATRWWRLLAQAGCYARWTTAFRLTYVGLFFNTVLPGSTGGDLARAYVVVRDHPERRASALTSVVLDRLIGLVAMVLLAVAAIWTADDRFAPLRLWVAVALAVMVLGLGAFVSPTLRRLARVDRLLARLPQGRRLASLDEALRYQVARPGALVPALLLSFGNHLSSTAAIYWIGHAFGDGHGFHDYLCFTTVANTVSALPLSPGGLGVGEVAFGSLMALGGGLYMLGVATSLVYRLILTAMGLAGGIFLLLPGGAAVRREFAAGRDAAGD